MSGIKALKFALEPDRVHPMFKRLKCQEVDVPIQDVLLQGVHPMLTGGQTDYVLSRELVRRINDNDAKIPGLLGSRYCHDVSEYRDSRTHKSPFASLLEDVQGKVWFADDIDLRQLHTIAREHLKSVWSHTRAREMARKLHIQFGDLRRFLKSKDPKLKLASYDDLNRYNLGNLLSVDDFQDHEHLVIDCAFPVQNFRSVKLLDTITDEVGRVKLADSIRHFSLSYHCRSEAVRQIGVMLDYNVVRKGETLSFRPDLRDDDLRRKAALKFAKKWRTNEGRLVFQSSMEKLVRMVEEEEVTLTFPGLTYLGEPHNRTVAAKLKKDQIEVLVVGGFCNGKWTGQSLKDLLSEFGQSTSGTKDQLLDRLVGLAVEMYGKHEQELDEYFTENKYIRVARSPSACFLFPLLEEQASMGRMVLAMYILKHLRGNTILDPAHVNQAYTSLQLANALVHGRVAVGGGFVRVA